MKAEETRFLWLIIFFDLPVRTKIQRRQAAQFRNFLRDDGFIMLQYSVYVRVGRGQDSLDKHLRRVRTALPKEGSVRVLQVTDKQYGRMEIMLGLAKKTEGIGTKQMVLL
ncbi:CRISPR-associated endonuclease Cas2 [Parasaccharibacter apium]|uniref:CRISPR-associated endoribonuclease Cas2 n=1 Tax=Parasaccharibacter apium TaxID=1510841 RepID=A0ABX4ZKE3_9PROT|nr:CRISPR-associated endonuclease Cas2 [Parasaccharibacter apium]POS61308.1 CRISPR-associated endonuclease Cas2 [Parasaccharibacter apium]POS61791.1 CRISPR-associated endonuclease Cas2 [Parasaccharibacter apium]POS65277.1 CRISPR-associated endonuclease Cas2 [Parasaccharibacter apium]